MTTRQLITYQFARGLYSCSQTVHKYIYCLSKLFTGLSVSANERKRYPPTRRCPDGLRRRHRAERRLHARRSAELSYGLSESSALPNSPAPHNPSPATSCAPTKRRRPTPTTPTLLTQRHSASRRRWWHSVCVRPRGALGPAAALGLSCRRTCERGGGAGGAARRRNGARLALSKGGATRRGGASSRSDYDPCECDGRAARPERCVFTIVFVCHEQHPPVRNRATEAARWPKAPKSVHPFFSIHGRTLTTKHLLLCYYLKDVLVWPLQHAPSAHSSFSAVSFCFVF